VQAPLVLADRPPGGNPGRPVTVLGHQDLGRAPLG
jgi:hypothetical protein